MIYSAEQLAKLRSETAAAILDYYDHPVTGLPDAGWQHDHSIGQQRAQQGRDARTMVTRALKAGISMRQLAMETHLPGMLIIGLIDDPQQRADAFTAELHHLERSLDAVRQARAKDAQERFRTGQQEKGIKVRLAESYGVTRVTLDAWLAAD